MVGLLQVLENRRPKKFYVKNKFVYDEREKTMRIGNSRPYNVEEFNGHTLKFNLEYRTWILERSV